MKRCKWIFVTLLIFSLGAVAQTSVFNLKPMILTNGWKVTGTITTDGAVGSLSAANILDWNLRVVQTTDITWTEKDSNDLNISGVGTDGTRILVKTSPDGVLDGGALFFARPGGVGGIGTNAVIADFTQLGVNLGYVGGIAGWQDEIWGLNFVGLNQRNNSRYRAALAVAGQANVFRITVPLISSAPLLMTMFGTITTDGTIGMLQPQNILAWNITARNQDITNYTKANSSVMSVTGVVSNGTAIGVRHAGGQFQIGIPGMRPTFVTLADFTDPAYPDGFINYYRGNYGVMGDRSPLVLPATKFYLVAKK
ncbi:MAG TPA: hypothetical protein VFA67_09780 [Candidatus Sulfotelmatobacter sp.]|nr:hypothetical protein [Candidatus Sulfotelmatobacter sp.]